ncbi:MAG: hypothetical protein HY671_08860 [Chloroflexi bacterium]|nr:hypothetical protein [Chloroflexota bacterium]
MRTGGTLAAAMGLGATAGSPRAMAIRAVSTGRRAARAGSKQGPQHRAQEAEISLNIVAILHWIWYQAIRSVSPLDVGLAAAMREKQRKRQCWR